MATFTPTLKGLIRIQHLVVSIRQLDDHGVTRAQRRSLLAAGFFDVLHRGVYIVATAEHTVEARCVAACLANPNLVVCGTTAGRLLGLRKMTGDDIHVIGTSVSTELNNVVTHRTNHLNEHDVITRGDGIRHLAPPRLTFNLADYLDDDEFESVVEQMIDKRHTDIPELFATGRSLKKQGRDGTSRFARVLAKRPAFAKPKNSDLEVKVLRAHSERGVVLIPQFELTLPDGSKVHPDGADPTRRFGVEVDHVTWHGGRVDSQYDKWRDRQTTRLGWVVPRVTDEELRTRFNGTISELIDMYHVRPLAA
jgi:hypothetical protein